MRESAPIDDGLQHMADALRNRPAPRLTRLTRQRMVQRALAEAATGGRRGRYVAGMGWAVAAAAIAALAIHAERFEPGMIAPEPEPALVELSLADGNRAIASSDAVIQADDDDASSVFVDSGELVAVSVTPMQVNTPVGRVQSFRSVFIARVERDRLRVFVIAGEALVVAPAAEVRLSAGEGHDTQGWVISPKLLQRAYDSVRFLPADDAPGVAEHRAAPPDDAPSESPETTSEGPNRPRVTPEIARRWLVAGRYEQVLRVADRQLRLRPGAGDWLMVRGDALRGLGESRRAADAYDRAAQMLPADAAAEAGYLAAWVRANELDDSQGALRSLSSSGATYAGSPIEESARVLSANTLVRERRQTEARREAERYLEQFAGGAADDWMRDLAAGAVVAQRQ